MKTLETKQEIAIAINMHEMPVVRIDLQGEAAFILPMTDALAAEYLAGRATDRGAVNLVETALEAVEVMRGRVYVRGSIKAYREAR